MKRSRIVLIAIFACSASAVFFFLFPMMEANYRYDKFPRAAIIDQLYDDYPNLTFEQEASEYLEQAGYKVDFYSTKNITVNFYKNLPLMGYQFIVIRSHASPPLNNTQNPVSADIFTGERYRTDKYTFEQILGQIHESRYLYVDYGVTFRNGTYVLNKVGSAAGTYFSVGSKFVDEQMQGKFPGSIIIIGGCASLSNPILADSLVKRGASTVIGWDKIVGADHNDQVMLAVLKGLLVDKSTVEDVIQSTMKTYGPDPIYYSTLKYYPDSAGTIHG